MSSCILFIDLPGNKPLPNESALRIAGFNCEIISVSSETSALASIAAGKIDIVVCNAPLLEIFTVIRKNQPSAQIVLVTEYTMKKYSDSLVGKEAELIDHVIANRTNGQWLVNEIRITIQKIVRDELFGIDKYLLHDTKILTKTVKESGEREKCNTEVMAYAETFRAGNHTSKLIYGITEELLMNAIFDATAAGGATYHENADRPLQIKLRPEHYVNLDYGCDGSVFAVGVTDNFGAMARETFYRYLSKVMLRNDSQNLIDTKKGGAGLGLFKILYGSHSLICNVEPNKKTEVIALIDLKQQLRDFSRMARSISYFLKTASPKNSSS